MNNFITKAVANSTAYYTWEIYFNSAVTDKNDKIITPVIMLDNSREAYRIGFVFSSETQPSKNVKITDYINSFTGYTNAYVGTNRRTDGDSVFTQGNTIANAIYYNSDLKKGVIIFSFTMNRGNAASCNDFARSTYRMENAIPYLGIYTGDPTRDVSFWENVKNVPAPKSPYELDVSTTGGGDGDYNDDQSDTIGLPTLDFLNANSISNTKFFSCYKMTPGQLSVFSEKLWTGWNDILQSLQNSVLKPLDFVVSLNMLPVNVESTPKVIKLGWFTIDALVQGGLINQQYVRVDCGSLTVKKKWGGAIDYQTDVSLFLPFIGEVSLNTNEVMGATLSIIYTVDIMSGNCIASVQVVNDGLNAILYQYNGNVASNYAITSVDYSNVMAGALQLAQGIGSIATGNMLGGISSVVGATSNMLSGGDIKRAGNLSATSGFMGIKKPYLILSRPIQSMPSDYNTFRGYVSNITLALSECSGYTKVAEIHLENIPATSAELDELDGLLKAGVIF